MTKTCIRCKQTFPTESFPIDRSRADGHHQYCRACNKEKNKEYYWKNRAFCIASVQHWRKNHGTPGYTALRRGRTKIACQLRAEINRSRSGIRSRYGKEKAYPGPTLEEWKVLREKPCFYCGKKATETDHLVSLKHGGPHVGWNLVRACRACNIAKHDTDIVQFALDKNRLDWVQGLDSRVLELIQQLAERKQQLLGALLQLKEIG